MKYTKQLSEFGLSKNEANVYLAALTLGNQKASAIASKSKLPKTTVIDALNVLNGKGFVSKYKKKNTYYYSAADPDVLESIVKRQQGTLEMLLPKLHSMQYSGRNKITVRFFDNKNGYKSAQDELLKEAQEALMISPDPELMFNTMPEYFPHLTKLRIKHSLPARLILQDTSSARSVQSTDKQELRQTRLAKSRLPFNALFIIWNSKVLILSTTDQKPVILIEDDGIVSTLRAMFEVLWAEIEVLDDDVD